MNVLRETVQLLIAPPGDLVYFLVTFFALQQAALVALTARQALPAAVLPKRWVWACGGLLGGRAVLIVLALLGDAGIIEPAAALPPVERGLAVIGVLLVIWAMLGARNARWQTWVMLALLVAALGFLGYNLISWFPQEAAGEAYNATILEWIWEVAAVSLLGLGLVLQLIFRPVEWEWAAGLFFFWGAGHVAQLVLPDPDLHFSPWLRLGALITFPLLLAYVQRRLTAPSVAAKRDGARAGASTRVSFDVKRLQNLLAGVETARELEPSLIITSSQIATFFGADACAIGLASNPELPNVQIVATHPPTGELDQPILDLKDYEPLMIAWMEGEPQRLESPDAPDWLPDLYTELGFTQSGPLLVLPLHAQEKRVGLLFLGNFGEGRRWGEVADLHELAAALLGAAIDRVQRRGGSIFSLREQDGYMLEELAEAQSEIKALNKRLVELQVEIKSRDREVARLQREVEEHSGEGETNETALKFWQQELQEMAEEREALLKERNRLGQELAKVKPSLKALVRERSQLRQQLSEAEEALEALKASSNGLENAAGVGLLVADESGEIRMADALARRLLALPEGEVIGTPLDGAYPDWSWAQAVDLLLSDDESVPPRTHVSLQVHGEMVEADLVSLRGRDGERDGVVVTLRTEKSLAEQQEAIVGIANEFRTPMTSITGYTDLLLGEQVGILTEMQRQFLERVKAGVEQMGQMLNDLLRLASPDAREIELAPQPIDLIGIIEQAIMGLSARFRERGLTVQLDLPAELPPVRADRDSLYQIMLRLLSNAALCSEEGTDVVVSAEQEQAGGDDEPPFVRIAVTDTGGGIAEEDFPKVFRRFFRARQPLIEGMGERGLGMAVAKTLVSANGGRIWVETEPGKGSTFIFVLPAHVEEEEAEAVAA
jgi:two-component system phosphate regulon sensor histidine kinase PhoR